MTGLFRPFGASSYFLSRPGALPLAFAFRPFGAYAFASSSRLQLARALLAARRLDRHTRRIFRSGNANQTRFSLARYVPTRPRYYSTNGPGVVLFHPRRQASLMATLCPDRATQANSDLRPLSFVNRTDGVLVADDTRPCPRPRIPSQARAPGFDARGSTRGK